MTNVKTPQEILLIEKACRLADKTLAYILLKIKPGVTEKQIASEVVQFIRKNSASLSFRPIVAFGKNSAEAHHKPNNTKLKTGDIVLLDLGAKLNGYCSDITRTVFMGKSTSKQKKVYQAVLKAQKNAIKALYDISIYHTVEIPSSEIDKAARDYIISKGYPDIPHGLGHGIGKKVHEGHRLSPKSKRKLLPGIVFSVEPGIYIKGFGGVRIDDLIVLEKTGPRLLTHFTKQIIEL